jgi:hypothetical protein
MAIQCGSSGHSHDTIGELKSCQGVSQRPAAEAAVTERPVFRSQDSDPAVRRAPSFRDLSDQVTEGCYAIDGTTGENPTAFYKIDKPAEGKWDGWIFVNRVIGGNPDAPVKGRDAYRVLREIIAAGPAGAMLRYGREMKICGECGSHLTREKSRAQGAGDTCYGRIMARHGA